MCVPQPSSNGHSLFGFALCEHREDQLLGKKAPSILIETPSSSVCFSLLLFTHALSSCFFSSAQINVLIACLFEMCMSVLPITYVRTYVCVYCTVYMHVYMYAWCPGSQMRASHPLEVVLKTVELPCWCWELNRVLGKAPFNVWQVGKNKSLQSLKQVLCTNF